MHTILDKYYGTVKYHVTVTGMCMLHFECRSWSKSIYLEILDDFADILNELNRKGFDKAYTLIDPSDTKVRKFQLMLGLSPIRVSDEYLLHEISTGV